LSGTFWRRHPDASSVLSFSVFGPYDFTILPSLCIYQLHHPQPRSISLSITLAHFDHLNDGQSFSRSPSSNCVHYKVYFILHFIVYTFYFLPFFSYVPMFLVKSPHPPVSAYFFGSSSLPEHIITLFVRAFHQHLFICIHFLFFSLTHLLLVLPCHIVPFNSIRLSSDIKSARSSVDFKSHKRVFQSFCILTCAGQFRLRPKICKCPSL
jgi:hypothetical protein